MSHCARRGPQRAGPSASRERRRSMHFGQFNLMGYRTPGPRPTKSTTCGGAGEGRGGQRLRDRLVRRTPFLQLLRVPLAADDAGAVGRRDQSHQARLRRRGHAALRARAPHLGDRHGRCAHPWPPRARASAAAISPTSSSASARPRRTPCPSYSRYGMLELAFSRDTFSYNGKYYQLPRPTSPRAPSRTSRGLGRRRQSRPCIRWPPARAGQ